MRTPVITLLVAVTATFAAGCGGDDDDSAEPASADGTSQAATGEDGADGADGSPQGVKGGDLDTYCELSTKLDDSFPEDADADTPEEFVTVIGEHFKEYRDDYEAVVDAAPDTIADDARAAFDLLERIAGGDISALEDPDFDQIATSLEEFDSEHC